LPDQELGSTNPLRESESVSLPEIAGCFLRLGTIAFGGPAAHISLMQEEFVRRRKWLSEQEFLDRLGAANLIPGPSSTEMAIYIGFTTRGWPGLIVAGCCFIIPAAVLVTLLAAAYMRFGQLPRVAGMLYGVKAVVVAVIVEAFWKLSRTAVKSYWLAAVGVLAAILSIFDLNNLLVLMITAVLAAVPVILRGNDRARLARLAITLSAFKESKAAASLLLGSAAGIAAATPFRLERLFLTFLKIGSVLFGSGYVLLAFLRSDFVGRLHWLTEQQVLDSVAVGQVTPGPVFTTATFIGYILGGVRGATVATVAIFLPGFLFVAASGRLIPRIRRSRVAGDMLDGVIVGSLALMGVVTWQLGRAALTDYAAWSIAIASLMALMWTRINPVWLIVAAGIAGILARF
jgi:chromate transporter